MPILVSAIVESIKSNLDAEGSERYLFNEDFKPAIHYAIKTITSELDLLFAQKKFAPEALVELTRTRVWQTDNYSRFTINPADLSGEDFWTLITVHPKATCAPNQSILVLPNDESKVRTDLMYVSSEESAARMTYEQSAINRKNPFSPGNDLVSNKLKTYAVLDASNYNTTNSTYQTPGTYAYEIKPSVPKELIGVRYLIKPTLPTLISDSIQFREQAFTLIVALSESFISVKQGDGTTLAQFSEMYKNQILKVFGS
jgi:hypothetical protein